MHLIGLSQAKTVIVEMTSDEWNNLLTGTFQIDLPADALAQAVKSLRMQRGITQAELARLLGISRNYVSLIERGLVTNMSTKVLRSLMAVIAANKTDADADAGTLEYRKVE